MNPLRSLLGLTLVSLAPAAFGQCPEWATGNHPPGVDGFVRSLLVDAGGGGAELVVGGQFLYAGEVRSPNVARWDGQAWHALGAGLDGTVMALATYDDGSGQALYAGGRFETPSGDRLLARFDGVAWSYLSIFADSPSDAVQALEVFDSGGGEALYFGGRFQIGAMRSIGRYDGTFQGLNQGLGSTGLVRALEVHDDGSGPRLVATGAFDTTASSGAALEIVSRWDGQFWAPLPGLLDSGTFNPGGFALQSMDFGLGGGPELFLSGEFSMADGSFPRILRWDGAQWAVPVGMPASGGGGPMAIHDSGSGPELAVQSPSGVLLYDGSNFTPAAELAHDTQALVSLSTPTGQALVSGHAFDPFSSFFGKMGINGLAILRNNEWGALSEGGGVGGGFTFPNGIKRLTTESGPMLLTYGSFAASAGQPGFGIARLQDGQWEPYAPTPEAWLEVLDLAWHDDGSGGALYCIAYGAPAPVMRWRNDVWEALPGDPPAGSSQFYHCLESLRVGAQQRLLLGGKYSGLTGQPIFNVCFWDGQDWKPFGGGVCVSSCGSSGGVRNAVEFDGGGGAGLVLSGGFAKAGGMPVGNIASWSDGGWDDLGGGLDLGSPGFTILDTLVYDSPVGELLVVSGWELNAVGVSTHGVIAWDGMNWLPLGSGVLPGESVRYLATYDPDGQGEQLVAMGDFTVIGGVPAQGFAIWDGQSWSELATLERPSLPNGSFKAFAACASFDDGGGRALHLAGLFSSVDGTPSLNVARLSDPCGLGLGEPFCTSQPNSSGERALLRAAGSPSLAASLIDFQVQGLPASQSTLLVLGEPSPAVPFGNGRLCLGGTLARMLPVGSSSAAGHFTGSFDFGAPYAAGVSAGQSLGFQAWFRDPSAGGAGFDTSDALVIHFLP